MRRGPPDPPPPASQAAPPAKPMLRALRTQPAMDQGQKVLVLTDPLYISKDALVLTALGVAIAAQLDGGKTREEIADVVSRQIGRPLPLEQVNELVEQLDQAYFLLGPRFETRRAEVEREFLNNPVRPMFFADEAYPRDPVQAKARFDLWLRGPGAGKLPAPGARRKPIKAIIAPHIDPRQGARAYAAAYRELIETAPQARLFIILGTAHAGVTQHIALSGHDFETPFGVVKTDRGLVEKLTQELGFSVRADEFAHRAEHSIEFQAVWLKYALGEGADFSILPVLVGSLEEFIASGEEPSANPEYAKIIGAFRELVRREKRQTIFVAGVDLAHLGTRFGDPPFQETGLARLEKLDREFLAEVLRGRAANVFANVLQDKDGRKYCGFPPLYLLAAILGPGRGEILEYGQDFSEGAVVSFSGGVVPARR